MYSALHATSLTLRGFLEDRFQADSVLGTFFTSGGFAVSLATPEEMTKIPVQGVSVWLYRVIRDEQRLNDPPVRISPTQLRPVPLPLRLHYLITPITNQQTGDPGTEQLILGKVLQACYGHPVLRGADLEGDFEATEIELKVRLESMTLEEITRVWEALEGSYQLSVSYEVSVVNIEPDLEPERITPVQIAMPEYGVIVGPEPS